MNGTSNIPFDSELLGYLDALRDTLGAPELDAFARAGEVDSACRNAAYEVAIALGRCRLFAIQVPADLDGVLPTQVAIAAAQTLADRLRVWTVKARELPSDWDSTDEPIEAEALPLGLLKLRMRAWAADVAIDEAYTACLLQRDVRSNEFRNHIDELSRLFDDFDYQLGCQAEFLSIACETELLNNWRDLLAQEYRVVPWWLDGTLEAAAERLAAAAHATQPRPAAWHRLRTLNEDPASGLLEGVEVLAELFRLLGEAFRRQFSPQAMLAIAANSDDKDRAEVLWDSKQDLVPLRCVVYRERNGDLRLDFSSTDDAHENQTFEVVIEEQTRPTVTFRRDPQTGELFGEARISRDELPEVDLSKLAFRLKRP